MITQKNINQKWKKIERKIDSVFSRKIIPIWVNELRNSSENFKEWEEKCLNFESFKFFTQQEIKILKQVFGSEKNLNYYYFWELNRPESGFEDVKEYEQAVLEKYGDKI